VTLPKTVAQNRNMILAGCVFTRSKQPAREGLDSEHAEKIGLYVDRQRRFRLGRATSAHRMRPGIETRARERAILCLPVQIICSAQRVIAGR
jgi:ribosomal protein L13E